MSWFRNFVNIQVHVINFSRKHSFYCYPAHIRNIMDLEDLEITDAIIIEKNNTDNEQETREKECGKDNCNCDENGNVTNSTSCIRATAETHNISDCSNGTLLGKDCNIHNNTQQNSKDNEIPDSNTVLKYVYKKKDKNNSNTIEKTKGHAKNSLKRRKRSNQVENIDTSGSSSSINNSPLIVDYETSHRPRGKITWLTSPDNPNIIRGSDLADFHIHTRHENLNKNDDLPRNSNTRFTEADHLNDRPQTNNQREEYKDNSNHKNSNYKRDSKEDDEPNDKKYRSSDEREYSEHDSESEEGNRDRGDRRHSEEINHESLERNRDSREHTRNNGDRGRGVVHNYNSREHIRDSEERGIDDREHKHERGERNRERIEHDRHDNPEYSKPSSNSKESHESNENQKPYSNSVESKENSENNSKSRYSDNIKSQERSQEGSEEGGYRPEIEPYDPRPLNLPVVKLSNDKDFPHPELFNKDINVFDTRPLKLPEVQLPDTKEFPHPESFTKDIKAFDSRPVKLPEVKLPNNQDFPHPESFTKEIKAFDSRPSNFHRPESYSEGKDKSEENESQINLRDGYINRPSSNLSSNVPIQEVDIGDFSYERIQVNEKGHVIPTKEHVDENDPNSAVEILQPTPGKSAPLNHHTTHIKDPTSNENYSKEPVNINDGEVKPVVEISGENRSSEISEENKTSEGENKSLESVLGIKINGINDKIVTQKEDVKQQFERIPLNYHHDADKNKHQNKDIEKVEPQKNKNSDLSKNDGTLDTFAPDNVKYDENLNIKFDDVTVKLPEIKLPDDILAYARENSPFKDELEDDDEPLKKPFYNYNNEEVKEIRPSVHGSDRYNNEYSKKKPNSPDKEQNEEDEAEDDSDHAYYGPYYEDEKKNQKYKKEETEEEGDEEEGDEDEDLYEKFVRERFGKQGTFEKRSEQLREATETPLNPHLYKTIQNILNKTAEIEKQAEESGDPKAGYMWTLEYGENL